MTTETATPAADAGLPERTRPSLLTLSSDAVMLLGLCEGLDVLNDAADGDTDCPVAKQARNAMIPMIASVIERASRLANDLEDAEVAYRGK